MNGTQETPRTEGPDGSFDPQRLRTITDMRRSKDDRLLGGVCAGAARYLNIDPVIVRVVIAALTIIGFAGIIIYASAWFLLPAEGDDKSTAADWFNLGKNEEKIRVIGLAVAGVLAAVAVIGNNGTPWGIPWFLVPLGALYYLFVVRPRRRREGSDAVDHPYDPALGPAADTAVITKVPASTAPRQRGSWALTVLTLSIAAIAVAATRIYGDLHGDTSWTNLIAVMLGVVAVGLLVGTVVGHGSPLIALGIVLALALAVSSLLPAASLGTQQRVPSDAAQVDRTYRHGIGLLTIDLTDVSDPDQLLGRTVRLRSGIGQTKVLVPTGLDVEIDSRLDAGQISVFGRQVDGTDNELDVSAATGRPALTVDIRQRVGTIEVVRQ
ncbi:PspC domain-containing protein [Aeromicrobium sp.]|uniref:PspC domain-containing protein n=1 Tax=Aeromicrobium sp. TaxID=1871063 RepID=UPI00198C753E|nr:PspC domain-containing protein [Aeromicrobium sp.]MBC7631211.1 PspC domain-containing protein [Aeromicrobium sp.]